jgi:hypothetical protein
VFLDANGYHRHRNMLTKSIARGCARLPAPSRVNEGQFCPAASPQLFKQLLMVRLVLTATTRSPSAFVEDLRADRQPEFTQRSISRPVYGRAGKSGTCSRAYMINLFKTVLEHRPANFRHGPSRGDAPLRFGQADLCQSGKFTELTDDGRCGPVHACHHSQPRGGLAGAGRR